MGLASANWEASCRTLGGTSSGLEVAIPLILRQYKPKDKVRKAGFLGKPNSAEMHPRLMNPLTLSFFLL
jgi:hypothetical protein